MNLSELKERAESRLKTVKDKNLRRSGYTELLQEIIACQPDPTPIKHSRDFKPSLNSIDEFIKGQQDCQAGVEHIDKNEHYTRGYNFQYHMNESNQWRKQA